MTLDFHSATPLRRLSAIDHAYLQSSNEWPRFNRHRHQSRFTPYTTLKPRTGGTIARDRLDEEDEENEEESETDTLRSSKVNIYGGKWHYVWYRTRSDAELELPAADQDGVDVEDLRIGDLFIHASPEKLQVWTWAPSDEDGDENPRWKALSEGEGHPIHTNYVLACQDKPVPSWVTRHTFQTYRSTFKRTHKKKGRGARRVPVAVVAEEG